MKNKLLLLLVLLIMFACTQEDGNNSELKTLEGIVVDKRETNHEPYQILVVTNIEISDINNKTKHEREIIAVQNGGAWYSLRSETYKNLEVGERVRVYYKPNAVLDSNPPQRWADSIEAN